MQSARLLHRLWLSTMTGLLAVMVLASAVHAQPTELWHLDLSSASYGSAVVEDIDCDGTLEILFGTYYNDERVLVLNAEDGSIQLEVPSTGGPVDNSVTCGDVDGDGDIEILWGNSQSTVFHVMTASGADEWTFLTGEVLDAPEALVDLDGNGSIEIVLASCGSAAGGGGLRALRGHNGTVMWRSEIGGCYQSAPLIFDVDGDSKKDVVVSTWFDSKVSAFSGLDGHHLWTFDVNDWMYHAGSFGDLDGMGGPEVAVGDYSGTLFVIHGDTGLEYWTAALGERYIFGPTAMGDLDGDMSLEVVVAGEKVHVFEADGTPAWTSASLDYVVRGPTIADADGDALPDVVVVTEEPAVRAFAGATGAELWTYPLPMGCRGDFAPIVYDLDQDGLLDIFVVCGRGVSSPDPENNFGRALALKGVGRGRTWPTYSHDTHHSGNFDYLEGNLANDPTWNPWGRCGGADGGVADAGRADASADGGVAIDGGDVDAGNADSSQAADASSADASDAGAALADAGSMAADASTPGRRERSSDCGCAVASPIGTHSTAWWPLLAILSWAKIRRSG